MIEVPSISDGNLKLMLILAAIILFLIAVFRTDNLLGEINYNLNPYKVIYYLMNDVKQLHKLNEKNYKKLAILSRSIQILFMDCGNILLVIAITLFMVKIAILSGIIYEIRYNWGIVISVLIFITSATTASSLICLYIILFFYYTMIFGQINDEIKLISNEKSTFFKRRKMLINKTKHRKLISLTNDHNLAAIEIHKINLIARRSIGCFYVSFAMMKIISLYLLVNFNEFFIQLFLIVFNCVVIIFGFGGSYFLTLQIKSAHQPLKTVYSIVCKYKMNLRLKLKMS